MYFKDRDNTNIDDEFENKNILSFIFSFFTKKIVLISIIVIVLLILILMFFINNKVDNYLNLNGEDIITIYKGGDYIEPGYEAFNSKNEDLTSQVLVVSSLDNDLVGEYEIVYTLGDIVKTRKIIVIEKPKTYTFIRLNTINNSVNVYLKLGEEYLEPGYQVFSSTGEDLSSKVEVTGAVDTSKAGIYKLVYTVIDSNDVTVSSSRTVVIMDSEISLTLSTQDYTNESIKINIGILDNYFDYLLLPDGTKIYDNTYSYEISENGKYNFFVYNKKGISKEASIEVKNIDKVNPTGSCKVTHNKNGSVITINATDNSGISRYEYNGAKYINGNISLNGYISDSSVNVSFYDKAGNNGKTSCTVPKIPDEYLGKSSSSSSSKSSTSKKSSSGSYSIKTTYVNVSDLNCTIVYGTSSTPTTKLAVNVEIADEFHDILASVCNYVSVTPWIDKLQHSGAYVNREITQHDYHSKGKAIDLNNLWTYTYNGKTYRPYSYQGYSVWKDYNEFVCDVCNGKEDCQYNINYIIFKRYFQPKGWCWGGNYGPNYFDPMHYELRDDACPTSNRGTISC